MNANGAKVIAVAEVGGAVFNKDGLDIEALRQYFAKNKKVAGFPGGQTIDNPSSVTQLQLSFVLLTTSPLLPSCFQGP